MMCYLRTIAAELLQSYGVCLGLTKACLAVLRTLLHLFPMACGSTRPLRRVVQGAFGRCIPVEGMKRRSALCALHVSGGCWEGAVHPSASAVVDLRLGHLLLV